MVLVSRLPMASPQDVLHRDGRDSKGGNTVGEFGVSLLPPRNIPPNRPEGVENAMISILSLASSTAASTSSRSSLNPSPSPPLSPRVNYWWEPDAVSSCNGRSPSMSEAHRAHQRFAIAHLGQAHSMSQNDKRHSNTLDHVSLWLSKAEAASRENKASCTPKLEHSDGGGSTRPSFHWMQGMWSGVLEGEERHGRNVGHPEPAVTPLALFEDRARLRKLQLQSPFATASSWDLHSGMGAAKRAFNSVSSQTRNTSRCSAQQTQTQTHVSCSETQTEIAVRAAETQTAVSHALRTAETQTLAPSSVFATQTDSVTIYEGVTDDALEVDLFKSRVAMSESRVVMLEECLRKQCMVIDMMHARLNELENTAERHALTICTPNKARVLPHDGMEAMSVWLKSRARYALGKARRCSLRSAVHAWHAATKASHHKAMLYGMFALSAARSVRRSAMRAWAQKLLRGFTHVGLWEAIVKSLIRAGHMWSGRSEDCGAHHYCNSGDGCALGTLNGTRAASEDCRRQGRVGTRMSLMRPGGMTKQFDKVEGDHRGSRCSGVKHKEELDGGTCSHHHGSFIEDWECAEMQLASQQDGEVDARQHEDDDVQNGPGHDGVEKRGSLLGAESQTCSPVSLLYNRTTPVPQDDKAHVKSSVDSCKGSGVWQQAPSEFHDHVENGDLGWHIFSESEKQGVLALSQIDIRKHATQDHRFRQVEPEKQGVLTFSQIERLEEVRRQVLGKLDALRPTRGST